MRTPAFACCLAATLLLAFGCGGKVAVDTSPAGTGGTLTGTGGNTTSTMPLSCNFACGGPIGLCGCAGPCSDGKMRAVGCGGSTPSSASITCDCVVDGVTVGTCGQATLSCGFPGSCCDAIFNE